jgi:hypothetical protein
LWRLKYAFIEEEEYSKEEKTRGENWEITQISQYAPYIDFRRSSATSLTRVTYSENRRVQSQAQKILNSIRTASSYNWVLIQSISFYRFDEQTCARSFNFYKKDHVFSGFS